MDGTTAGQLSGLRRAQVIERRANLSTEGQWHRFAGHRVRLTEQLLHGVEESAGGTLCVLGAGNCNDLDLALLGRFYSSIHLVDLDEQATNQALLRHAEPVRDRIVGHPAIDITGILDKLPRWKRFEITPAELMAQPSDSVNAVCEHVGQRFDRVVSTCVFTQLQLAVLRELGAGHRLFEAVTHTVTLTHLRLIAALTAPGGAALLVSEMTSNETYPLAEVTPGSDLLELLRALMATGNAIGVAHPAGLIAVAEDDPTLRSQSTWALPHAAWIWEQGPERSFLTYALWMKQRSTLAAP
jgi:hypothetical protein